VRIVHFSITPLAGAPIRLVQALQRHANYDVSLVDLDRWGRYDHDMVHVENPARTLELARTADIIHLHNYLDYQSKEFDPVNFDALRKEGKAFIRQFHSHPELVAQAMQGGASELLSSPIPSLVIAQFQERFYPNARVVPNIIPQDSMIYSPGAEPSSHDIFFSPTSVLSAWDDRWNTKGTPETLELMKQVARKTGCTIKCMTNSTFQEAIAEKRRARVVIDDLITGSYHLSGLEGLSLGKPVFSFLDGRTQRVLGEIAGTETCPFVNLRLEDSFDVLLHLLEHPEEAVAIGEAGRKWIERYWSDHILVQHFVDVYENLLVDPQLVVRQDSLRLKDTVDCFHAVILPDLTYLSRANNYQASLSIGGKALKYTRRFISFLGGVITKCLPAPILKPLRGVWSGIGKAFAKGRGGF
jgi:hypothetical protein